MNNDKIDIQRGKKIYFVSDSHLGIPNYERSLEREKKLVKWLDIIKHDAQTIFLLGDIFDFWFEYKYVVPRGYTRLFGKLCEIIESGIPIHFFIGNHDMWVRDFFTKEIGLKLHKAPIQISYNEKIFYIGHGDGLGPGDFGYKFMKKIFSNKICRWLFARLHPNFAFRIALFFSKRSRLVRGDADNVFLGENNERLILFAKEYLKKQHINFFIFGHRHLPIEIKLSHNSTYFNTGDWFNHFSYISFDGHDVKLQKFK